MNLIRTFDVPESVPLQIHTKLVLATGSRAGTEAPIQLGYYMIGRHQECQIRPKSRSVSRRHCLIHRYPSGIRAYDLGSTRGTKVNGQPLRPNQWLTLNDGDQLQCGKIVFDVSVKAPKRTDASNNAPENSPRNSPQPTTSMLNGEAWQEFNVVGFLDAEDESEREKRYSAIRGDADDSNDDFESDFEEFPEDPLEVTSTDLSGSVEADALVPNQTRPDTTEESVSPRSTRIAAIRAKIDSERKDNERGKRPDKRAKKKREPASPERIDAIKLHAVILLTVISAGVVVYSGYRFATGPPVRVIEGID